MEISVRHLIGWKLQCITEYNLEMNLKIFDWLTSII
jgi:hypothetical protein